MQKLSKASCKISGLRSSARRIAKISMSDKMRLPSSTKAKTCRLKSQPSNWREVVNSTWVTLLASRSFFKNGPMKFLFPFRGEPTATEILDATLPPYQYCLDRCAIRVWRLKNNMFQNTKIPQNQYQNEN